MRPPRVVQIGGLVDFDAAPHRSASMLGDASDEAAARQLLGVAAAGVRFHHTRFGDIWLRDTGPIFVGRPGELSAARFRFDGWGGKYVMPGDTEVAANVMTWARVGGAAFDFVLEGGASGDGASPAPRGSAAWGSPTRARRPRSARCRSLAWRHRVARPGLQNDHTDGHIDTLARFVAPGVVTCMEAAADDPNRDALDGILADVRDAGFEVVVVPSPGRVLDATGTLLPASYMNFYLANTVVVVPTYGVPADDAAVAAIARMFPTRRTVAVDGKAVVVGGGAFHCSTQQQPSVET